MIGTHSRWELNARSTDGESREALVDHCAAVMDALLAVEQARGDVHSAAVSLDAAARQVVVDLCVETDDVRVAESVVDEALRQAVELAGGVFAGGARLVGRTSDLMLA